MTRHALDIHDGALPQDEPGEPVLRESRSYLVVNAIFKNGRAYEPGETIDLEVATGGRFVATGDVKETKS